MALEDITGQVISPLASKFAAPLEQKTETVLEMLGRDKERLAAFEAVDVTPQTGARTSKVVEMFFSCALTWFTKECEWGIG